MIKKSIGLFLVTVAVLGSVHTSYANNYKYLGQCTRGSDNILHPRGFSTYIIESNTHIHEGGYGTKTTYTYGWLNCYVKPGVSIGQSVSGDKISCDSSCTV